MLAIVMVAIAVYDRDERVNQRKKKSQLLEHLNKQKKILSNRFDLHKNLTAKSEDWEPEPQQASINFAGTEESSPNISSPQEDLDFGYQKIDSETNLARILIEGEDISTFPPEWQEFFVENEGKEPIEKLNKILKNGQND